MVTRRPHYDLWTVDPDGNEGYHYQEVFITDDPDGNIRKSSSWVCVGHCQCEWAAKLNAAGKEEWLPEDWDIPNREAIINTVASTNAFAQMQAAQMRELRQFQDTPGWAGPK